MFGGHDVSNALGDHVHPLYFPQSISGYEKVRITTTKQTSTMETEPLLDASLSSVPLVIFVRKLILAL